MRYATVCSGAEAFGPAWHELGYEPVFHAEIEKHASAVLAHHYPTIPNYGDFTTIAREGHSVGPVRLLCGGTPCQTFSVAGLREGLDSYKGGLSLEFVKLAQRLRAQWILWENVPGVLSADGGEAFGSFLGALAECGYGFAYRILDAQHFGVPQRRRRVFVVGYLGDWRPAAAVLFEPESLSGYSTKGKNEGARIADTLTVGANQYSGFVGEPVEAYPQTVGTLTTGASSRASYRVGADEAAAGHIVSALTTNYHADRESEESKLVITAEGQTGLPCLTASSIGKQHNNQQPLCITGHRTHTLTADGFDASEDGTGRGTPIVIDAHGFTNRGHYTGEVAETLRAQSHGALPMTAAESAVRRLTPRECERLMGWADDWTRYGVNEKGQQYALADGPRYRICGNGWAAPVATWIAKRIKEVDSLTFF